MHFVRLCLLACRVLLVVETSCWVGIELSGAEELIQIGSQDCSAWLVRFLQGFVHMRLAWTWKRHWEFFLNRAELSLNSANSRNLKITERWIGLNLMILSLHVSCWCCVNILVSHTRGGCVAGSSPFTAMTNIFVTEFCEKFRKNSVVQEDYDTKYFTEQTAAAEI